MTFALRSGRVTSHTHLALLIAFPGSATSWQAHRFSTSLGLRSRETASAAARGASRLVCLTRAFVLFLNLHFGPRVFCLSLPRAGTAGVNRHAQC